MLIKSEIIKESEPDVFRTIGVRELARLTGLDVGYLSRVKNNQIPVTLERYLALWDASDKFHGLKERRFMTNTTDADGDNAYQIPTYKDIRNSNDQLDRTAVFINGLSPHNLWRAKAVITELLLEARRDELSSMPWTADQVVEQHIAKRRADIKDQEGGW